ncbi:RNA polymerase sigma factor [Noviherbaspirillum sp. ST9]|uniref:RNA polymerase sigma factor n=1 Tax=Noviherbaspirillum sp. ST9 TaxID=3401606 RepID=UPI003B58610D
MADFAEQLAQHIPRLRRYARALAHDAAWADDLVQDTLERALQRRWQFRIDKSLTAWLFTILYRRFLNDVARHRAVVSDESEVPEPAVTPDFPMQIDMQRALAKLTPEHRAVIVLVGLEQVSYQEAAEVLDVPIGTVMSRLSRAREHLRAALSGAPAAGAARLSRIK